MPSYYIPTTATGNIDFLGDLEPAFGTYDMNVMGDRRFPRVTSNIGISGDFANKNFLVIPPIDIFLDTNPIAFGNPGTMEISVPFDSPAQSSFDASFFQDYVIDGSVYSTFTITHQGDGDYIFNDWRNSSDTVIGTNMELSISLSTLTSYSSIYCNMTI